MLNTKALAASASATKTYVEDVFSTWLYDGNGSTQTITNGIDLAGKGGLVWIKRRDGVGQNQLFRDAEKRLASDSANAETITTGAVTSFDASGFSVGANYSTINSNGLTYASWTFRKQAKFFDVVTYTGNGSNRTIAHSLGSVPGTIIVKRTDTTGDWQVYHRSLANTEYMVLNTTAAKATGTTRWNSTTPTSTEFSLGTDATVNANTGTYVAYLFAHDTSADGLIQCGTFTTDGSGNATVELGWEPQWVLVKRTNSATDGDWWMFDTLRGANWTSSRSLSPNTVDAELSVGFIKETGPTSFLWSYPATPSSPYVYIAIRRGPMKTPTDATKVFQPKVYTGTNVDNRLVTTDIVTDMVWARQRNDSVLTGMVVGDRMRGQPYLLTGGTAGEVSDADSLDQQIVSSTEYGTAFSSMTGFWVGNDATSKLNANTTASNHVALAFRRAPGFFDIVAYTGTGANRTVSHNLGVVPELYIIRCRDPGAQWMVSGTVLASPTSDYLVLNLTQEVTTTASFFTTPTSTTFGFDSGGSTASSVNGSGNTYIAYLFASCPGVSKVGTYTGTGTTLSIDCGFTAGARFVLIKRTDSTRNWFVWDTARGIVSGNDPYLLLNSTVAEATATDYIDPLNSGFQISSTAPDPINGSGGSYIYLAIA